MKIQFLICASFLLLTACTQENNPAQVQQNALCQYLIQGYLKAQALEQDYLFHQAQYQENQSIYTYRKATTSGNLLGIPSPQNITFSCGQNQNSTLHLKEIRENLKPISLLTLKLNHPNI